MSYVTTAIVMIDELPEVAERFLAHLNAFDERQTWFELDVADHFGGYKCGEAQVYTAALNHIDVEALCSWLGNFDTAGASLLLGVAWPSLR
jgi:hypothetical protein